MTTQDDEDQQEPDERREEIRLRLLTSQLLGDHDQKIVTMDYDGYGDSGGIQHCSVKDKAEDPYQDFLWDLVATHHGGFYNNEGGSGTVSWDLQKDVITIDHSDNIMTTQETQTVL